MKTIVNPFVRFSENSLLVVGLLCTVVGSWLGSVLGVAYDGVLDLHFTTQVTFVRSLSLNIIDILVLSIVLFFTGYFINKKTRVIDILTSVLLYRIPFYLAGLFNLMPSFRALNKRIDANSDQLLSFLSDPGSLITLSVVGLALLIFIAWAIILLFFGFKIAVNAKKATHFLLFGAAVLVAEVFSKIFIYLFI